MQPSTTSILRIIIAILFNLFSVCASAQSTHVTIFSSVQLTAFYREDAQFDAVPVSSSEAVLSIYKSPYNQPDAKDQIKLIKGRKKAFDKAKHNLPEFINLSNGARSSLFGDFDAADGVQLPTKHD